MITITFAVRCDGADPYDSARPCDAGFDAVAFSPEMALDTMERNIAGQRWRRDGDKFLCPLHPQAEP